MDLSRAYGSNFMTQPLGTQVPTTLATEDIVPVQMLEAEGNCSAVTGGNTSCIPRDVYSIHIEIGRDDAHLLCMFIAALILSLLFSSRR